jgi:hypothetical protein
MGDGYCTYEEVGILQDPCVGLMDSSFERLRIQSWDWTAWS